MVAVPDAAGDPRRALLAAALCLVPRALLETAQTLTPDRHNIVDALENAGGAAGIQFVRTNQHFWQQREISAD